MEEFKKLEELNKPDERNLYYRLMNMDTGESRRICVEDVYRAIETIILNENVPEDVVSQFSVAKNLALYSWYSYPFHQISEMKAFSCVELALKIKVGKEIRGLSTLIKKALSLGLIKDNGFRHIKVNRDNPVQYSEMLPKLIPKLRNELAHGSTTLHTGSIMNLQICADLINQLYEG